MDHLGEPEGNHLVRPRTIVSSSCFFFFSSALPSTATARRYLIYSAIILRAVREMIEISQVVVGGCEEVSLTCAGSGMVVVHSATFLPLEGDCEQVRGDVDSGQKW